MNKELYNEAVKKSLANTKSAGVWEAHINLFNDLVDVAIDKFHSNDNKVKYYLDFVNQYWANLDNHTKATLASVGYEKQDFVDEFTKGVTVIVNPKRGKKYFLMGRQ